MHAEVAELWDTLMHAGRETQQHEAAATAMRGEITTLRGSLARAEREGGRRAAATEALDARGKLAWAEGTAKEREAVTVALRAEIATLQDTLAAAREVGKAATAALRSEVGAPKQLDRPRGWRPAVMRLFGARASA